MAEGKSDPLLHGSIERGFEGLIMMPGVQDGQPDAESLGIAHLLLAKSLSTDIHVRRQAFREQAVRAMELWAMAPESLIQLADRYRWVEEGYAWAVDSLCAYLTVDFGEVGQGGQQFWLVWHWFARCFEAWGGVTVKGHLCGGHVLQVEVTKSAAKQCRVIQDTIKLYAPSRPDISEREALGHIGLILQNITTYAKLNSRSKTAGIQRKTEQIMLDFIGCLAPA
jgi:hypothetical protein